MRYIERFYRSFCLQLSCTLVPVAIRFLPRPLRYHPIKARLTSVRHRKAQDLICSLGPPCWLDTQPFCSRNGEAPILGARHFLARSVCQSTPRQAWMLLFALFRDFMGFESWSKCRLSLPSIAFLGSGKHMRRLHRFLLQIWRDNIILLWHFKNSVRIPQPQFSHSLVLNRRYTIFLLLP